MECDTFDECFFGGHTEHFKLFPFNERLCYNWHLYAVEACLHNKCNQLKYVNSGGYDCYICDVELLHLSSGNYNPYLYINFLRLCRAYSKQFPFIRASCAASRTDFIGRIGYAYRTILRPFIVSWIKCIGLYSLMKKIRDSIKKFRI